MSCQIIHTKNFRLCIWVFLREQEKVYYCLILKKFSANVSLTEMAMPCVLIVFATLIAFDLSKFGKESFVRNLVTIELLQRISTSTDVYFP